MQEIKHKWKSKGTVKKALIILTVFVFMLVAFFPALNFQRASAIYGISQFVTVPCTTCAIVSTAAFPSNTVAGDILVIVATGISTPNGGGTIAVHDSQGNSYNTQVSTYSAITNIYGNVLIATAIAGSSAADHATCQNTFVSDVNFACSFFEVTGASLATVNHADGNGTSYGNTCGCKTDSMQAIGVTIVGATTDVTGVGVWSFQYPFGIDTGNGNAVQFTSAASGSTQSTMAYSTSTGKNWGEAAISISVPGGGGGGIILTNTYTITWTNSFCTADSTCANVTGTTTIHYDNTTTTVVTTTCSTNDGGGSKCVTGTISTTKTVVTTFTTLPVNSTTTITRTNTAINAPSAFDLQFWLVPLIFLMGPAFGFMGGYSAVVRERGGTATSQVAIMVFMIGLNLGAISGIILKVMPFPVLILTIIPLVLLLYFSR